MAEPRHRATYAWRARLGLIVPSTNTVNEAEWARLVPPGVTVHAMRMPLHAGTGTAEGRAALLSDFDRAAGELVRARVDAIAYACTAGSMVVPPEALAETMSARCGVVCVTTAAAIVVALGAVGARRVAVATPYHDALNAHEVAFLRASGIAVTAIAGLGIGAGGPHEYVRIAETPVEAVRRHALSVLSPEAEALLITCTDFPSLPILAELEQALDRPVVTSNTATLWQTLRRAGIDDDLPAGGRLFRAGA